MCNVHRILLDKPIHFDCFLGGVPVEASDSRCTHLVVEDSVTELPSGLLDQSHCQAVKQEVSIHLIEHGKSIIKSSNTIICLTCIIKLWS